MIASPELDAICGSDPLLLLLLSFCAIEYRACRRNRFCFPSSFPSSSESLGGNMTSSFVTSYVNRKIFSFFTFTCISVFSLNVQYIFFYIYFSLFIPFYVLILNNYWFYGFICDNQNLYTERTRVMGFFHRQARGRWRQASSVLFTQHR